MPAHTDADVQAAAKAIARLSIQGTASWLDYSRAAVDAVAPAIAARAKAKALRDAAWAIPGFDGIRTHGDAARWLRDRADEIEAGS